MTTAAASFELYVGNGYQSVAVYGVAAQEFVEAKLRCHPDPLPAIGSQKANAAHAYVDYSLVNGSQGKKIAKRLRNVAVGRGRLYPLD